MQRKTLKRGMTRSGAWVLAAALLCALPAQAAVAWLGFGPYGGDVRSFATDPTDARHIYMGTANGWVYESRDGGAEWHRLARVGSRDDLVLDHIVVDATNPQHLMVGAWVTGRDDGGLWSSEDGGRTWQSAAEMAGQSVRALAAAPSDARILVAGALSGVYRSKDGGAHWTRISPEGSTEIHEIESLAIDPAEPEVIYAGTWHLPWKTTDGGAHWVSIKDGVIEDSDVFSIILDRRDGNVVYASACSGIYKSSNAGEMFKKVEGIPSTARRTRVLRQDPVHPDVVFAGTTEGLFRTADAGSTWMRVTRPEDVVNDISIDPVRPEHMLIATDRGGVLASEDGGFSFKDANRGFSARQVEAYAADPANPARVYVGVVNDKDSGGVFASNDGGLTWEQREAGLHGMDVFALSLAPDGTLLAGANHGLLRWTDAGRWEWYGHTDAPEEAYPDGKLKEDERTGVPPSAAEQAAIEAATRKAVAKSKALAVKRPVAGPVKRPSGPPALSTYDGAVFALLTVENTVYAATGDGLLASPSAGMNWHTVAAAGAGPWRYLAASRGVLLAADLKRMETSEDGGKTWKSVALPTGLTQLGGVAVDGEGELWAVGGEGIWFSRDGAAWTKLTTPDLVDVNSVFYDAVGGRVLVTANGSSTFACAIRTADKTPECWDTGWHLRMMRPVGDHMVAATLYDGVVVQPRMVESPLK